MHHSIALLLLISVSLSQSSLLFVGTYQNPPGGIQIYDLRENGNLVSLGVGSTKSPSSLALHPSGKFLYSSSETQSGNFDAWRITNSSGTISLVRINTVPSEGDYPAHLSIHPSGNFLLGTNYGTGNFLVFPINSDGSLGKATLNTLPGAGSKGKVPNQNGPHAHQMVTGTNGEIYGVDLGSDSLFSWNFNQGDLTIKETVSFPKGAGPRHAAHGPNGMVYVVAEYGNRVFAFQKGRVGELRPIQNLTSLPPGFSGYSAAGEIRVHPNGKFLYITNRGANNIAIYNITQSGALKKAGFASTGNYPRGMTIDPTGDWMIIGNQYGNSLFVMQIQENGQLLYKSQVSTSSPVDIVFHSYPPTLGKIAS